MTQQMHNMSAGCIADWLSHHNLSSQFGVMLHIQLLNQSRWDCCMCWHTRTCHITAHATVTSAENLSVDMHLSTTNQHTTNHSYVFSGIWPLWVATPTCSTLVQINRQQPHSGQLYTCLACGQEQQKETVMQGATSCV